MPKIYLFLFVAFSLQLQAQKNRATDFIINLNGERIEGEIKLQSLREHQGGCQFKAKGQSTFQAYSSTQLQAFYTHKTLFVSKLLPDSTNAVQVFLECYFKGKYSLYGRGNKHYVEREGEALRSISINGGVVAKDGVMVKRPDGAFLGLLRRFSSECEGLGLQIQANVQSYDLKSFLDLLEDYHKCLELPYQRYGTSKETYRLQWELGVAAGGAQMPLKASFMNFDYFNMILHNGEGFSANAAVVIAPQRYIFFPSLVIAPDWSMYAYHQNKARYIDDVFNLSTYIESRFKATFFAIPVYLRQPVARLGQGFLFVEAGARFESVLQLYDMDYLVESEGVVDRQYPYIETKRYDYFTERARGFSTGFHTGVRLSFGDANDANGVFALGFRYSRVQKKDPKAEVFDQPILLRNNLFNIYLSKRF